MTNPIRGSHTDEPFASLKLHKDHRDLLVDLILTAGQAGNTTAQAVYDALKAWLLVSPESVTFLREGLCRSLADPDYLAVWIEQVRKLRNGLLPFDELDESFVQVMLADGPAGIEDLGRLAFFALSRDQLEVVHSEIVEALPTFWIDVVEDAMSQSARERGTRRRGTSELLEEVEQRIADKRALPAAALDMNMGSVEAEQGLGTSTALEGTMSVVKALGHWKSVPSTKQLFAEAYVSESEFLLVFQNLPLPWTQMLWDCGNAKVQIDFLGLIVTGSLPKTFRLTGKHSEEGAELEIVIQMNHETGSETNNG